MADSKSIQIFPASRLSLGSWRSGGKALTETTMSTAGIRSLLCLKDSRTSRLTLERSVAFFTTLLGTASPSLAWPQALARAYQPNGPVRPRHAFW